MITLIGPLVRSEYSVYGQPYLDVEAFGEGFAVLEADGKIHFYNSASEQTSTIQTEGVSGAKLMCSVSDALVIAGETSLSCLLDGRWLAMDVPETSRITCLTAFYGGVMAASEDGKLLFWGSPFDKAQIIKAEVSGRFIGMSSFADRCYAVTDRSEIVSIGLDPALASLISTHITLSITEKSTLYPSPPERPLYASPETVVMKVLPPSFPQTETSGAKGPLIIWRAEARNTWTRKQ